MMHPEIARELARARQHELQRDAHRAARVGRAAEVGKDHHHGLAWVVQVVGLPPRDHPQGRPGARPPTPRKARNTG